MEIISSFIGGLLVGAFIMFLIFKSKIKVIKDVKPNRADPTSIAMQLSNELAPYFKEKDGFYILKIFKD